jgi:hypothetical protein
MGPIAAMSARQAMSTTDRPLAGGVSATKASYHIDLTALLPMASNPTYANNYALGEGDLWNYIDVSRDISRSTRPQESVGLQPDKSGFHSGDSRTRSSQKRE